METITTATILDRGAKYLTNRPDDLAKRIALAQVLVDARAVRSLDAATLAFKIWATPTARDHPVEVILNLANERAKDG
jgi:hypothetical protein